MGTPYFSVPILKSIYQNGYSISVVYTQPPQKSQRGLRVSKSPVQGISETLNIEYRIPEILENNQEEYDFLKRLNADLAIVVAYGQKIPKNFLNLTKKGFINIHGSVLPKWRGAAPIQRSLEAGENLTGCTAMLMEPGLDSGPILLQKKLKILKNDDSISIHNKLSYLTADCLLHAVDKYLKGKLKPRKQNPLKASYAKKLMKEEGSIDWKMSSFKIYDKLRAFRPFPGVYAILNGFKLKIIDGTPLKLNHNQKEGTVLETKFKLVVACGNNTAFSILTIQKAGKNKLSYSEFLKGTKIEKGYFFE